MLPRAHVRYISALKRSPVTVSSYNHSYEILNYGQLCVSYPSNAQQQQHERSVRLLSSAEPVQATQLIG